MSEQPTTPLGLSWEYVGEELAIFWQSPYGGGKEKIASFWWPTHPVEATAEVERTFEAIARHTTTYATPAPCECLHRTYAAYGPGFCGSNRDRAKVEEWISNNEAGTLYGEIGRWEDATAEHPAGIVYSPYHCQLQIEAAKVELASTNRAWKTRLEAVDAALKQARASLEEHRCGTGSCHCCRSIQAIDLIIERDREKL